MWRARLFTAALTLLALGLAALVGAYLWALSAINAPGPLRQPATVIVTPGTGLAAIARQLESAHVIRHGWLFQLEARRAGQARLLKPGEYRFEPETTLAQVLAKLVARDVVGRFVTIPEGLVTAEIAAILAAAEGLTGEVPSGVAEGELLPETYRYEWGDTRADLVARMRAARRETLDKLWAARAPELPLDTPDEAVILASIVEKETGVADERGRVAAVFVNRLRRKMRLQSDPTVIYGLAPEGLGRALTRADLETPTPYNTYVVDRLPPGPICHPGAAALAAVLNPPATDELYFVADGSGGHAFARTLDEHNRNVARWRRMDSNGDIQIDAVPPPQSPPTDRETSPGIAPKAATPKAAGSTKPSVPEVRRDPKPPSPPAAAPPPSPPPPKPRAPAPAPSTPDPARINFPPG